MTAARLPAQVQQASGFLREGRIPTREHTYSALELFLFSAATWNPHRVHYDQDYTRGVAGEPELLVQGPLQAAHMFQLLREALSDGVAVRALEYRHRAVLHAGEPVRISGRLVSGDGATAAAEMWVESSRSGQRTTTGLAHVQRTGAQRQAGRSGGTRTQERA
jgi:hydroxyacyl-ACP dehydratase HTD2-like protein with hotdog domain